MKKRNVPSRFRSILMAGLAGGLWLGCTDAGSDAVTGPDQQPAFNATGRQPDVERAIAAQERHQAALMRMPGVVGTAVGLGADGRATIRIFLTSGDVLGVPAELDGVPVARQVTGLILARSNPTTRARPAPVGFSVGHPAITAGTIGARVIDAAGGVYILSNNHVLANSNNASIGDPALQPGPFDGGTIANDQVGTLAAFQAINFSGGQNTMDAAIAQTTTANVGHATPSDDGYGAPSASIWGDANGDGVFDNKAALLGLAVTKYGRTTKLTQGTVTGINASLSVCYEVFIFFCVRSANFQDQLIVEPGAFSGGGDSGSLIVSANGLQPVGLLFAGSSTQTIANRIDLVLNRFGVRVDDGSTPPPTPSADVAITGVSAPASITQGNTVDVVVTIRNVGTANATSSFDVTLADVTDGVTIGTQNVNGLAAGATTTRTFAWNTTGRSTGPHTLRASHSFADGNTSNDALTTTTTINPPSVGGMHVGDLDGWASNDGSTWSATVEVTVHDAQHNPINGATVRGTWSPTGLASTECTTGDLGGNGTCIFLYPGIRKRTGSVSFTVTSVTRAGQTYQATANHDPDGSSNGTVIVVIKP